MNTSHISRHAGFTMVEILVAMTILVIAFALVTVLYVRAVRIRRVITSGSEVQQVLAQMMNTIAYRDRNNVLKNLESATRVYRDFPSFPGFDIPFDLRLVFNNATQALVQYYWIEPGLEGGSPSSTGSDTTLWYAETSNPSGLQTTGFKSLDLNKQMTLQSGTKFRFYDARNRLSDTAYPETTTVVGMTLIGKSNDPAMKNREAITVRTAVRLRNKPSF